MKNERVKSDRNVIKNNTQLFFFIFCFCTFERTRAVYYGNDDHNSKKTQHLQAKQLQTWTYVW